VESLALPRNEAETALRLCCAPPRAHIGEPQARLLREGFRLSRAAAQYYDANPHVPNDIPFYKALIPAWEVAVEGGRVTCHERRPRTDPEKLILYPELIYRRSQGEALSDEARLQIATRCYYPAAFEQLIVGYGFQVIKRWGGYAGEPYGEGPELVIQFGNRA
jgi:hypothetical protein